MKRTIDLTINVKAQCVLSNENLFTFPMCKELKNTANTQSVLSFSKYDSHLELLSKEV
jgi:hypothetical protein